MFHLSSFLLFPFLSALPLPSPQALPADTSNNLTPPPLPLEAFDPTDYPNPYTLCLPPPHSTSPFPALPNPDDCRLAFQSLIPYNTPDTFVLTTDTHYTGQRGFVIANTLSVHGTCAVSIGLVRKDLVTMRKREINAGAGGLIRGCLLGGEGKAGGGGGDGSKYGGIGVWMASPSGGGGGGQGQGQDGGGNIVYVEMGFWDGGNRVGEGGNRMGVEVARRWLE